MKATTLIGKTITRVHRVRVRLTSGVLIDSMEEICFGDGSWLSFHVKEMEDDYAVEATYHPPKHTTTAAPRCNCESAHCRVGHTNGDCRLTDELMKVDIFGHKTTLCRHCRCYAPWSPVRS